MKILHITPAFYPAHVYGGPIESVFQLCKYLVQKGLEVRILTTDANGTKRVLNVEKFCEVQLIDGLRVRYCHRLFAQSVSLKLMFLLPSYIRWTDITHLTGVYSFPTIPTLLACKILDKPVVWSPRGAFQRWEGSTRIFAKRVWDWICLSALPRKIIIHVTSEEEAFESQKRFPGIKTVIIPNGIEVPKKFRQNPRHNSLHLLFLGRIHPIKGIENLLAACNILNRHDRLEPVKLANNFEKNLIDVSSNDDEDFDEVSDFFSRHENEFTWELTIAGNGDLNYVKKIQARIEEFSLADKVRMIGEVQGEAKQKLLDNSDIVIIPSYKESFGMVAAEALSHGVPVIISKGMPWKKVEGIQCGLWVNNDAASLALAIYQMSQMPLYKMGLHGWQWMRQEFTWEARVKDMIKLYENLIKN